MHIRSARGPAHLLSLSVLLLMATGCSLDSIAGTGKFVGPALGELDGGASDADGDAPAIAGELDGGTSDATSGAPVADSSAAEQYMCGDVLVRFEPRAPTVFILADRSRSMFEQGLWEPLKAGVLSAVQRLERDVRFGFSAYTGEQGGTCPELSAIANSATREGAIIRDAYDAIGAPAYKGETPTALALGEVSRLLDAAQASGRSFVLLLTDGEPDLCDDDNLKCARDALVAAAQEAYASGIGTLVVGVGGDQGDRAHLTDVANAGAGQPVLDQQGSALDHCPAQATYGSQGGSARFYEPDLVDPQATSDLLSTLIATLRSCVFDLQGGLAIDPSAVANGLVELDGIGLPYADPDGFRMNSPSELELLGGSCERLRQPDARVWIEFPCDAVLAP
jgi:hypothetical protein